MIKGKNNSENNALNNNHDDTTNDKIQIKVNKFLRPIIDKMYIHQKTTNNPLPFSSLDNDITGMFIIRNTK